MNYRLTLCYDGTRYSGWQKQGSTDNTIQGKLEQLLSRLLDQSVEVNGSGRTDAGVHAREQVCSFRAQTRMETQELLRQIRMYLPEDIGAVSLEEAPPRFHARLSAVEKTYVYRVWNSELPDVFERRYRLSCPGRLDIEAMRRSAQLLCGTHDYRSFCGNRHMKKSTVRTVHAIEITGQAGGEIRFTLTGDGFLYHMVRLIVGTLLEVGAGERDAQTMAQILEGRDRALAGGAAPACGLTLWEVRY